MQTKVPVTLKEVNHGIVSWYSKKNPLNRNRIAGHASLDLWESRVLVSTLTYLTADPFDGLHRFTSLPNMQVRTVHKRADICFVVVGQHFWDKQSNNLNGSLYMYLREFCCP